MLSVVAGETVPASRNSGRRLQPVASDGVQQGSICLSLVTGQPQVRRPSSSSVQPRLARQACPPLLITSPVIARSLLLLTCR
jgi:hypothetical protein